MTDQPETAGVEPKPGKIDAAADVRDFVVGGEATFTLVSLKTGARFTYLIRQLDDCKPPGYVSHFAHVLTNPDNERGYTYLGNVRTRDGVVSYDHGKKSKIDSSAPSALGMRYLFEKVVVGGQNPADAQMEFYHSGRCGRCGRKLTVPESIRTGIGPECRKMIANGD